MNKNKNQKSAPDYSQSTPTMTSGSTDDSVGARDAEILKFNSSIHVETSLTGPSKKVFTYYWKITDMTFKLSCKKFNWFIKKLANNFRQAKFLKKEKNNKIIIKGIRKTTAVKKRN